MNVAVCYAKGNNFSDMEGNWASQYVQKLFDLGAINGMPDGTFNPNGTITRAEFAKIIVNSLNLYLQDGNSFLDTANHWSKKYVQTALKNNLIVVGDYSDYKFLPDNNLTRIEMAKMITRAMGKVGEAERLEDQKTKLTDDSSIASGDKGYVLIAVENGIINGYSDGSFRPNDQATRAEASKMIINMLQAINTGVKVPELQLPSTSLTETVEDIFISPNIKVNYDTGLYFIVEITNQQEYLDKGNYQYKIECTNYTWLNQCEIPTSWGSFKTIDNTEWKAFKKTGIGYTAVYQLGKHYYTTREYAEKYPSIEGMTFEFKVSVKNEKQQKDFFVKGIANAK